MSFDSAPPPTESPVTEQKKNKLTGEMIDTGRLAREWVQWFFLLEGRLNRTARVLGSMSSPVLWEPLPITPFKPAIPVTGFYRISYYLHIVKAANGSSSIAVQITWVDNGVTQTHTSPVLTGNSPNSNLSNTIMARIDGATSITTATIYSSNPTNQMQYTFDIAVEGVVA